MKEISHLGFRSYIQPDAIFRAVPDFKGFFSPVKFAFEGLFLLPPLTDLLDLFTRRPN